MTASRTAFILLFAISMAGAQPRQERVINSGWMFTRQDAPRAELSGYGEIGWEKVSLPHTWNALDGQDGGNNYYRGAGWYRKRIAIPAAYRSKSLFLKFDGASTVAQVFVNGERAGEHRGAFGAFCLDVTPFVRTGAVNVIAVRVSNAPDTTVPPLRGDFTVFGGLYRSVHLLVLDRVSISPVDDASPGVLIRQKRADSSSAVASVTVTLRNGTPGEKSGTLRCDIRDARGRRVAGSESRISIPPGGREATLPDITIDRPHLWQGRVDPYVYRAEVSLSEKGSLLDRVVQPVGFRSFRVDPGKGFFLNGRPYPLYGVNRHQDREGMGWAINKKEHEEDYALIADLGCTAVRLAHYQHAQEFYDLCDRGGIVVWAELALVDEARPSSAFADCCRAQLRELIKQSFNHPSIVFWSLSNELIPDRDPSAYTRLITELNALAKGLDPDRLTTLASRGNYDWSLGINNVTDVIGYNFYKGWYEKTVEDFGPAVDALHARLPDRPMCISEYGAGAGIHQHEEPPKMPRPAGAWHPEEWQSIVHEATWREIARRPWIWGAFVWNMFDFASDGRSEGELPGRNDKGLVTYDRKVKKDAFFWYRANWNASPMVYIAGRRFTPRPSGPTSIKVYSNCGSVSLFVNGRAAGTKECPEKIVVWDNVALEEGKNRIVAVGAAQAVGIRDSCTVTCRGGG